MSYRLRNQPYPDLGPGSPGRVWPVNSPVSFVHVSDPDLYRIAGLTAAVEGKIPGMCHLCWSPDPELAGFQAQQAQVGRRSGWFRIADIDLVRDLVSEVGKTSLYFSVKWQTGVEIIVESGAKVRYWVGGPAEYASRDGSEPASPLIVGSETPTIVPLRAGECLHLVTDSTETAELVHVDMAFRILRPL